MDPLRFPLFPLRKRLFFPSPLIRFSWHSVSETPGSHTVSLFTALSFSILGAAAGYLIGYWVWEIVGGFFLSHVITAEAFATVSGKYSESAFGAVLAGAFTPIPFKAFTVTAGVFKVDFLTFIAACAVGRTARFAIVACLLSVFGARVKLLIDKYFNIFTVIFFTLLLVGVLLLKKLG